MALSFPIAPSNGDEYTISNKVYIYDSSVPAWNLKPVDASSLIFDNTGTTTSETTVQGVLAELTTDEEW